MAVDTAPHTVTVVDDQLGSVDTERLASLARHVLRRLEVPVELELSITCVDRGTIEVAPLAYMRGRTLNDSFIVLDEAQNTTAEQMKMFLTRLGFGSKAVVTGDVTQVDLPSGRRSGLRVVRDVLADIDGVSFAELTGRDVVRHRIVQQIVEAYERYDTHEGTEGGIRQS